MVSADARGLAAICHLIAFRLLEPTRASDTISAARNVRRWYLAASAFLLVFATGSALNLLLGFKLSIAAGLVTSVVVAVWVGDTTRAPDR